MESCGGPTSRGCVLRNIKEHKVKLYVNYQNHTRRQAKRTRIQELTNENEFPERYLGATAKFCNFCNALDFTSETNKGHFNSCCHNRLISRPNPTANDKIKQFDFNNPSFVQQIKKYKSTIMLESFSETLKDISGIGPYYFSIQNQIQQYI